MKSLLACVFGASLVLSGCASLRSSLPGGNAPAPASAAASAPAAAASGPGGAASGARAPGAAVAPAPGTPTRSFAEVIRDAKQIDGLFTAYTKDERVWIELRPEDLNVPFFFSPKFKTGIGENRLFAGTMGDELVVEFRRVFNQIQLVAINTDYASRAGTPEGRAIDVSVSPSLVGSAAVLSQPHPTRKSILIEANSIFLSDLMAVGVQLQRSFRQGYSFDSRNSAITAVRGEGDLLVLEVMSHFATASLAQVPPGAPPGAPVPSIPRSIPDPRSLFVTLHYSLGRLPVAPMRPRLADPRLGYFTSAQFDFGNDLSRTPRQRYVNRWRLEKKDPAAVLSEPVKPITYWIDRDMPVKYRAAVTEGILEWNKAFERIGFKDAVKVEVQPDDASFDTLDLNRASVRWMTNWNPQFGAIGPSHVDPRTGEILDADIGVESLSSRAVRALRSQVLTDSASYAYRAAQGGAATPADRHAAAGGASQVHADGECSYADEAAEQMSYALDVLAARGDIEPDSPEAEQYVLAYLKDTMMHEVGHTLGLRHNFRASRIYSEAQLADPAFTAANGVAGSVMEYSAVNLPEPGLAIQSRGTPFQTTLGPYDYWAIDYAYRPLPAEGESAALLAIASRSSEPWLAYGTDEDNYLGIDPETLQMDLGADVLAFARKRIDIARDLLGRQETRALRPDRDYAVLRRSVAYAVRDVGRAAGALVRQIGGVRTLRDFPGTGRDPLAPLPVAQQRDALNLLTVGMLSPGSLQVSPALQRRLGTDFAERGDALRVGDGAAVATDYSFTESVSGLQRGVLAGLMSDTVASRLVDNEAKQPGDALRLSELYARIDRAVWGEIGGRGNGVSASNGYGTGASIGNGNGNGRPGLSGRGDDAGSSTALRIRLDIPPLRRELQRDHVNRLATLLTRPGAAARADARSLTRVNAQALLARLREAADRPGATSAEARAHLLDCADTLAQALSAPLQRSGA